MTKFLTGLLTLFTAAIGAFTGWTALQVAELARDTARIEAKTDKIQHQTNSMRHALEAAAKAQGVQQERIRQKELDEAQQP